jgi:hypothetical protein
MDLRGPGDRSPDGQRVRRVLVALELGRHAEAALAAAARLCAGNAAELSALFVEDEDLHRIAALPVTRVLGTSSARTWEIDAEHMTLALAAQAERVSALVRSLAARAGVPSRFRVERGKLGPAAVEAARDADLVLLGKGRAPAALSHAAVSAARAVAERRPVLLVNEDRAIGPPAVLVDGGAADARVLHAGAYLCRHTGGPVLVLATGPTIEAGREAGRAARDWLHARGMDARVSLLPLVSSRAVLRALAGARAGTLVVSTSWPAGPLDLATLLEEAPLPVMIAP